VEYVTGHAMRILLTGAAGFIGSHLAERLTAEGDEVTGLDAFDTTLYDAGRKHQNLARLAVNPRFRLVEGDILDAPLVAELAQGQDLVVHLAAVAGVRPSIAKPALYARTNVEGTTNVLEACRAAGVTRLVFASSSSVYGARTEQRAFSEDDPCIAPASPYAASKRAGELLCSAYRDLHGLGISALRFFTVYGPRQRPDMAIHKFTAALIAGQPLMLFGETARDYTYIDDIIDGTVAACRRVTPGRFEIYNLGGTRTTGLRDLALMLAGAVGVTTEVVSGAPQPGDVPLTWADTARARRDLGYEPKVPLSVGLASFVRWYRETES
jgi:UDP-glucuronate 4-epimerase